MRFGFLKAILTVTLIVGALVSIGLYLWGNAIVVKGVLGSGVLAFVNVVIGCFCLEYGIDKSTRTFMLLVFGGMGVRMAGVLIAFAALLLNGFDAMTLSLSLMGFYVVFMIAELYYVVTELNKRSAKMYRTRTRITKGTTNPRRVNSEFRGIEQTSY